MNSILQEIISYKREFLKAQKTRVPVGELKQKSLDVAPSRFARALKTSFVNLIAEIKKASPSKGVIREDFDCVKIARDYAKAGAACLSVLTENKYFLGGLGFLERIKPLVDLPLLRKDFIIDAYQVYESKAAGADAILLIASILKEGELKDLYVLAQSLKLDVLLEVHTREDLRKAVNINASVIGVNARNLDDFSVDLNVLKDLKDGIPKSSLFVCESGVNTIKDLAFVKSLKPDAILVGEALMRSKDVFVKTQEFVEFLKRPEK